MDEIIDKVVEKGIRIGRVLVDGRALGCSEEQIAKGIGISEDEVKEILADSRFQNIRKYFTGGEIRNMVDVMDRIEAGGVRKGMVNAYYYKANYSVDRIASELGIPEKVIGTILGFGGE